MDLIGEDVCQRGELVGGRFVADVDVEADVGGPESAIAPNRVRHRRHPRQRLEGLVDPIRGPRTGEVATGEHGYPDERQRTEPSPLTTYSHGWSMAFR
ncbi:Uncharacterised protein [Mycobacteroides abscessus subsp. abscessus]|nr:Uncharacterised protein [Mycobacteroides abscessus subsp. abscessus]